jgi:hypothetical protein
MRNVLRALAWAGVLAAGVAAAVAPGDRVLAQWDADGLWYPARITAVEGRAIHVAFDDGDVAEVGALQVREVDWRVGTRLECNWHNQGRYYGGVVTFLEGERIDFRYDDGDRETMTIGRCRSGVPNVE